MIFTKILKIIKKIKKNTRRYQYFIPVCQQSSWYDLQFLRYRVWQTKIGNYGSFFALYPPPKNQKNQNFEKMKKIAGDMEWDRQNFFSVWAIFCLYTLLTNGKIKILKQRKKHLEMSSLYTCVPKFTIIWCILPEIWNECLFFFCHFGTFFAL